MAKIVVIVGSVRSERHGIKVAKWVISKLEDKGHQISLVDPLELDLPLLDKMYKEMESPSEKLQKLQKIIKEADGYVPITPEYNHSVSSALKNTLDYFLEEYFFKPSAIISYSMGPFGGVIAGNHLRQILAEWVHLQFHHNFRSLRFMKHLMLMENYLTKIMRNDSQNS